MLTINNKTIEEKIKHLKKAIEIIGGNNFLQNIKDDSEFLTIILENIFKNESSNIVINGNSYTVSKLLKIKLEYEKSYIKLKKTYIQKIKYKIDQYNTQLDSIVRRYKKTGGIEEFRAIKNEIETRYKSDINNFILSNIDNITEENTDFYGDYLKSKKEDFINSIISSII